MSCIKTYFQVPTLHCFKKNTNDCLCFCNQIKKVGVQKCLICEECVSMLRDASAFKKKVLDIQETIETRLCWEYNDTCNIGKIGQFVM